MEDLIESVTRGNPTEVKVVLASVALALGCYQLLLIAIGYGKLRPGFLSGRAASFSHRAIGDALAVVLVVVAAKLGPTSTAELDAREERLEMQIEAEEEEREQREDRLEEQGGR